VLLAEEELTIKIGYLNVVVVSTGDLTIGATTDSHHGESFHVFTTQGTGTNHKSLDVSKFILYSLTIDLDLIVVSASFWCTISINSQIY